MFLRFLLLVLMTLIWVPTLKGQHICKQIDSLEKIQVSSIKTRPLGRTYNITISTQEEFNKINESITTAIRNGKTNIKINIKKGTYKFHDGQIILNNEHFKNTSLRIEGHGLVIITGLGENLPLSEPWTELFFAEGRVKVIDIDDKICFLSYKNTLPKEQYKNFIKLQLTQSYRAPVYKIIKIDGEGLYFIASDLKKNGTDYNVNDDYTYSQQHPRFRLYDESQKNDCVSSSFIDVTNCKLRCLSISNITFRMNKGDKPLISLHNFNSDNTTIKKCTFDGIGLYGILGINSNNITVAKCLFSKTAGNEICFGGGSKNVYIVDNIFTNCGLSLGNTHCVVCNEAEYYIARNNFVDFGYSAIGVGLWHGHDKKKLSQGVIEHNEMYYTQTYFNNKDKYTLMDGGAIYTWCQNDGTIIRYNYIHDFTGMCDNRGIFCDDGASNISIYGNVILNTPNSYCIDLRRVKDHKASLKNNSNNIMANNLVDGAVRFQGYEGENRQVLKGQNIVIREEGKEAIVNVFDNLESLDDLVISDHKNRFVKKQIKKCLKKSKINKILKII